MSVMRTTQYDVADYLRMPEDRAAYLDASIEECDGDAARIGKALGDIARAQSMSRIAAATGLSRESLYKSLSDAPGPDFDTILRITRALGVRLQATVA